VLTLAEEPLNANSLSLDVSEESILSRATEREYLPSVSKKSKAVYLNF